MPKLAVNVFDVVVLITILTGIAQGRKRGMSEELLAVLQWLLIVFVGAETYRPAGDLLRQITHLGALPAYLAAYLAIMVLFIGLFSVIRRTIGEKLVGSDAFGGAEYYLGMVAGAVRFCSILFAALALLNARYFSPAEIAAEAKDQQENFGTISFPTLASIQQAVFVESMTGPLIKRYMSDFLIAPTPYNGELRHREGLGKRLERDVDETIGDSANKPKK